VHRRSYHRRLLGLFLKCKEPTKSKNLTKVNFFNINKNCKYPLSPSRTSTRLCTLVHGTEPYYRKFCVLFCIDICSKKINKEKKLYLTFFCFLLSVMFIVIVIDVNENGLVRHKFSILNSKSS
jgi:hypothetical protein